MTKILTMSSKGLAEAVSLFKGGEVVAFPTETVYGLGADATNDIAVAKIFKAKGRPNFNPLISHVENLKAAKTYAEFDERAELLAQTFWPGPLTLVLKRKDKSPISKLVSAGLNTIALRVPGHPVAQLLLKQMDVPIAAPSANASGKLSPTTPQHVMDSLGGQIQAVIAGGKCDVGLESTVIDLSGEKPILLRPGSITHEVIEKLIGKTQISIEAKEGEQPKSPGQLLRHYAPKAKLRLQAVDVKRGEALLGFGDMRFMAVGEGGFAKDLYETRYQNLSVTGDLVEAAANLFDMLHKLDLGAYATIAVMDIPDVGLGVAINDRLRRATKG